jgi:hypothetical protein
MRLTDKNPKGQNSKKPTVFRTEDQLIYTPPPPFDPNHKKQLNNAFSSQLSAHSRHGETIGIFSFGKLAFYKSFLYPTKKEFFMKNLVKLLALSAVVLLTALTLAGCPDGGGGGGGGTTHTHSYSTTWSSNATQHWHECTANDGAKTDVANHTGDPCSVCNYSTHAPYIGTWFAEGSLQSPALSHNRTLTITENRFDITDTDGNYIRFDITSWTPVTTVASGNTYPTNHANLSNYPSGFTLGVSNLSVKNYNDPGSSLTVYLHSDGNSIKTWQSIVSSNAPSTNVYVKQ